MAALATALALVGALVVPVARANPAKSYMNEAKPRIHVIAFANSAYATLAPLPSVARDYELMRQSFAGENMILHGDDQSASFATKDVFWDRMRNYLGDVRAGDVVFFYYSGHGFSYQATNFLLPLSYPDGPVHRLDMSEKAVSLNVVINFIRSKGAAAAVLMLDSCRTGVTFKIVDGTATEDVDPAFSAVPKAGTTDRRLPFRFKVLFASRVGGEALALSSRDRASFFTQAFHEIARDPVRMDKFDNLIQERTFDLTDELPEPMQPEKSGDAFGFAPKPVDLDWQEMKEEWETVIDKRSVDAVLTYLRRYPLSHFAAAAREYLDDQGGELPDGGGNQLAFAANVDRAFEVAGNDMVAVINSTFPVRFTRVMSQEAVASFEAYADEPDLGIVRGQDRQALLAAAAQQVRARGTKGAFDAAQFGRYGEVSSPFEMELLAADRIDAPVVTTMPKGVPFRVPEFRFDSASGDLFAKVELPRDESGQVLPAFDVMASDDVWAKFSAEAVNPEPAKYANVLGVAGPELSVPVESAERPTRVAVAGIEAELARLGQATRKINWVSIATPRIEDARVDSLRARLNGEPDLDRQAALRQELRPLEAALEARTDNRDLRALHARHVLVKAGVPSTAITIVNGRSGVEDTETRLRFFTEK